MQSRTFLVAFVSSVLLVSAVGCSAATTPAPSSDSDKKDSKDSKKNNNSNNDDDDDSENKDSTDTDKLPSNPSPGNPDPNTSTPSKKKDGSQCKESGDCESDFCVFKSGGSLGMCTKTCDDNIDCDLGSKCVKLGDAPQKACVPE